MTLEHVWHPVQPVELEHSGTLPSSHTSHDMPAALYLPASHVEQDVYVELGCVPAAQAVHVPLDPAVPGLMLQETQAVSAVLGCVPAPHIWQAAPSGE